MPSQALGIRGSTAPRCGFLLISRSVSVLSRFLALAPSTGAFRIGGFIREVARFAVPAGVAAGAGVVASYLVAR
jgi:cation-transporting P-type ATPase E